MLVSRSAAASALLALALAGVAFGAGGGSQLGRTTLVEVGVVLVGGGVVALAAARRPRSRPGGLVLLGFLALSVLTAVSVAWSIDPEASWIEADRTLAYLAALAAGTTAAWLAPRSSSVVLRALLLAVVVVVGYGLVSRI